MAISDHLTPAPPIGHAFLRDACDFWDGSPQPRIDLLGDTHLRAARVDGASPLNQFIHVTLPHLKGVLIITILLLFVANLNHFTIPWIMTGGGPAGASDIWITQIYQIAFGRIRFGIASAYSVILFIVMVVIGYFYVRALTAGDDRRRPS